MGQGKKIKKHIVFLWILFAAVLANRLTINVDNWTLLTFVSCILSTAILRKTGMPSRDHLLLSLLLAVLCTVAYFGYEHTRSVLIYGLFTAGLPTLLAAMAVFGVMEKKGGLRMIAGKNRESVLFSIGLGFIIGMGLSAVNLMLSQDQVTFGFSFWKILLALNPAINEEISFRAVFMAYCCLYADEEGMSGPELFTMYFMMCIPHTMAHGYGFVGTLLLCLFFGLPFTFLQHRRDILTAMVSHGIVDAVRFILTGF